MSLDVTPATAPLNTPTEPETEKPKPHTKHGLLKDIDNKSHQNINYIIYDL